MGTTRDFFPRRSAPRPRLSFKSWKKFDVETREAAELLQKTHDDYNARIEPINGAKLKRASDCIYSCFALGADSLAEICQMAGIYHCPKGPTLDFRLGSDDKKAIRNIDQRDDYENGARYLPDCRRPHTVSERPKRSETQGLTGYGIAVNGVYDFFVATTYKNIMLEQGRVLVGVWEPRPLDSLPDFGMKVCLSVYGNRSAAYPRSNLGYLTSLAYETSTKSSNEWEVFIERANSASVDPIGKRRALSLTGRNFSPYMSYKPLDRVKTSPANPNPYGLPDAPYSALDPSRPASGLLFRRFVRWNDLLDPDFPHYF